MSAKIKVAVVGASGYTGVELMRLLNAHPQVELCYAVSRQYADKPVHDVFPSFSKKAGLKFSAPDYTEMSKHIQVVFLAMPHHASMETARIFRDNGIKVIDLSADFRFTNIRKYEDTYGPHSQRTLAKEAVYGLCEIFAQNIKKAKLIAVPGCYVTSILLGLAPLLQNQVITLSDIICDSKSGISGAGRKESLNLLSAEINNNFSAYGLSGHRHRPEIEEKLGQLAGRPVHTLFTPHLLPVTRGILSTIYARPLRKWKRSNLTRLYEKFYKKSPFVRILDEHESPQLKAVVGTNFCDISCHYDADSERIVVLSALDNLLKGASGQAVQAFNLMHGLDETMGLGQTAVWP